MGTGDTGRGMTTDVAERKLSVWEHGYFTADMCEALIGTHGIDYGDYSATMCQILERMLSTGIPDEVRSGVIKCIHALQRSASIFRRRQQHLAWAIPFHLSRICDETCKQLHSSSVGDIHIFPFQCSANGLLVVEHVKPNVFNAAVVNTDPQSTTYHPFSSERPPKILMQTVLEVRGIPRSRIASEAFWACIFVPTPSDAVTYTHLIPWLTNGRTYGQVVEQNAGGIASTGSKSRSGNLWKCFIHALKYILRRQGVQESLVKVMRLLVKQSFLQTVLADLSSLSSVDYSTRLILRAALRNGALSLTRNGPHVSSARFSEVRGLLDSIQQKIDSLPCPDEATTKPPPALNITSGYENLQMPDLFPLAECLRRMENTDDFIGASVEMPRYVPVNFFRVRDTAETFNEALQVLDEAVLLCNRITMQSSVVRNSGHLISALLTHVFATVLPVPLGPKSRSGMPCLWNCEMRYGQQLHCMKRLWQCAEFFTWSSFSFKATKEYDAQRIIVLGVIATIGDAVIRVLAVDHPSIISHHLRGFRKKSSFAVSVGKFSTQTESSVIVYPQLVVARAAVLDYHAELSEDVPAVNVMWAWEDGWGFCKATQAFLRQICLTEGLRTHAIMNYFAMEMQGSSCVLGKYWEEYRYHRDLYIVFKWVMAPRMRLPTCAACLQCKVHSPDVSVEYGNHRLAVRYMHKEVQAKATLLRFPSFAIPSKFTAPFEASTEDDLLHIKNMPTFDDCLGQRDSELLLSYLTAPYIRIPLVLNFFATEDRVSCLGNGNIRNLLEAVLFEPGRFLPRHLRDKVPTQVPSEDAALVATPFGLLFNEMQFSPHGVVDPLLQLVRLAREMDAGTVYNSSVVEIILFLVRLTGRVESYLSFVHHCLTEALAGRRSMRGVEGDERSIETVRSALNNLRSMTSEVLIPMLEAWNEEVMSSVISSESSHDVDKATRMSSQLHSHILVLVRNSPAAHFDRNLCSLVLSSMMYLTTRHTFCTESLHIPETEIFDVMQVHRRNVASRLYRMDPKDRGYVLDSIVRVSTSTGVRREGPAFPWGYVAGEDCVGRFTRVDEETLQRPGIDSKRGSLQRSLCASLGIDLPSSIPCINEGSQDVEVNVHTLSLTFKAAHLVSLPSEIALMDDVRTIFAPKVGNNDNLLLSMQCAVMQDSENRQWVRLVGQEHDIQYWKTPDHRVPLPSDAMRFFPDDLSPSEQWVFDLIEPVRRAFFVRSFWQPPIFLLMPEHKLSSSQTMMVLSAVCSRTGRKLKEIVALRDQRVVHVFDIMSIGRRFYRRLIFTTDCHYTLRELQTPYHDRRNPWQPWQRWAAGNVDPDSSDEPDTSVVILRHPSHPDNLSKSVETFLPSRVLEGVVPDALLETHTFWQDPDDNIRGYPKETNAMHLLWLHWKDVDYEPIGGDFRQTCVQIYRFSRSKSCPKVSETAVLLSQQLHVMDAADEELQRTRTASNLEDEVPPSADPNLQEGMYRQATTEWRPKSESAVVEDYNLLLLNLLNAREGTPLHSVARVFGRIELLSHVLCWTTQVDYDSASGKALTIDLVSLPRLKLSFSMKVDAEGNMQLFSADHAHLFVSNLRPERVTSLLQGIPHSLMLSDVNGNIAILVPAMEVVRPSIGNAPFSTELIIVRENKQWYTKLDTRYYLYTVHVSMSFLFAPTLASSLYLLVLRFLHCEYEDVFRIASTIGTDVEFTEEEDQNFGMLSFEDDRPEAHACRCKIGLLVADSPVLLCWFLPHSAAQMIHASNAISMNCRLSPSEESRLLHICSMVLQKCEILSELMKTFREELLDTVLSRISGKLMVFDGPPAETRQIREIYSQIAKRFREKLGIRTTREETSRVLLTWTRYYRYAEYSKFHHCLIMNRKAILDAEVASLESGKPEPATLVVPPIGTDDLWQFYRDYDPLSVRVPEGQQKLKNGEDANARNVSMSDEIDYFYCGEEVRKPGQCQCKNCDVTCGPSSGCPCKQCERFNRENLPQLRYIPARIPTGSSRMITFYDAFKWIEDLYTADRDVRLQLPMVPVERRYFDPQVRRYTLRHDNNSFLRYYEMMTGTTKVRIGSGDCAKDLAVLLFPLSHEAHRIESAHGHLLHYMLNNGHCWNKLPKYNRQSKTPVEQRMTQIYSAIMQQGGLGNRMPPPAPVVEPPPASRVVDVVPRPCKRDDPYLPIISTRILPQLSNTDCVVRTWGPPDVSRLVLSGEDVTVSAEIMSELRSQPLVSVVPGGLLVHLKREEQQAGSVSSRLPFDLRKHAAGATTVAQSMIQRLEKDVEDFARDENQTRFPRLAGLHTEAKVRGLLTERGQELKRVMACLEALYSALVRLRERDSKFVTDAFSVAERTANNMAQEGADAMAVAVMSLRRMANQEATMQLSYLVSCIACTTAEHDWRQLNPFLSPETCREIINLLTAALLRANRVGHANRAAEATKELLGMLTKAMSLPATDETAGVVDALTASVGQKAASLAGILAVRRVYMDDSYRYDPRLLIFEFTWNLILRSRQRTLINEMYESISRNESIVKQMIMGAGKTTVVGPLLALMLADGKNLVIQVVPPALLDFTRSILRGTFSSVVQKQIFCFICDRSSEVDSEVLTKFRHARNSRGIVVTTPSSIKSIFLKYIEGLSKIEDPQSKMDVSDISEVRDLGEVLRMWREAVLIMDEVDMLLHPLKSELNFPIGVKCDLDFAPARWKLPIHLLDALFYYHVRRISVGLKESPEAHQILGEIRGVISRGLEVNALQATPHLTLLNLEFYDCEMKLPMARWLLLFLKAHHFAGLSDSDTLTYIMTRPSRQANPALNDAIATLDADHVRTLNLSYEWLNAFLPHCLQKIDRVSFGIMNMDDMRRAREEHPNMPRSRYVTAIPFIGKDLPSQSSEFAHPDVVIGLTILAYRYEGLRRTDFNDIMRAVHAAVEREVGRFHQRRTNVMYNRWVLAAGGRLLQSFSYGVKERGSEDEVGMQPSESFALLDGDEDGPIRGRIDVLPLKLMKQANKDESDKLFRLFRRTAEVIHWHLCEKVFPEYMRHQKKKLSASGQELGGDIMFRRRIGFSGTPSDLLPFELGKCEYEPGTDGKLVYTLTSPSVVRYEVVPTGWTVRSILDTIACATPPFHALIDTGALITGMSNLQVAQYLLKHGLTHMEGVVFLDEFDRKMILVRATGRVLKLAECGIPKVKRFAFYDQVHTTGMDIEHTPNAQAVQTLGKDMTFRDYSQGAYRMRGIGLGQTIHLMIIPEVMDLINRTVTSIRPSSASNVLNDVTTWLLVNSIRSEHVQYNQLCVQTISNVWRKQAFATVSNAADRGNLIRGSRPDDATLAALEVFREAVDYEVPNGVPQPRLFSESLSALVEHHWRFIDDGVGGDVVRRIVDQRRREDEVDNPVIDVQMVQEQEEERENVEEREKQQEIEMEKFVDLAYSRDEEVPTPWALASLRDFDRAVQFYRLSHFHLYKRRPMEFPTSLLVSRNYYNPKWSGHRRIKNVVISMEWIPDASGLEEAPLPYADYGGVPPDAALAMLGDIMEMLREHQGNLNPALLRELVELALGPSAPTNDIVAWRAVCEARTVEDVLAVLRSNQLRYEEQGRFTVALALCEAETIRRVIHARRLSRTALIEGYETEVALTMVPVQNTILDASLGFRESRTAYQRSRNFHCLRYFDGDQHYTEADLNLLLRSTHLTVPRARQAFFMQVLSCRRRARQSCEKSPVSLIFTLVNPYSLLKQRAIGLCMKRELEARELHLADAFLAMNSSHSGQLAPHELWGSMRFLRLGTVRAEDVLDFIQVTDTHHEGTIHYPDFLAMLTGARDIDDDEGVHAKDEVDTRHLPTVEPYGADELRDLRIQREAAKRQHELEANREMESEDRRVREEIEQEQMREELETIQTSTNPRLDDRALTFMLTGPDVPKLAQFYGPIKPNVAVADSDTRSWSFADCSRVGLTTRSLKLITHDPFMSRYAMTFEFMIPRPKTIQGKDWKHTTLQAVEDCGGEDFELFSYFTNTWELSQRTRVMSHRKTNSEDECSDEDENLYGDYHSSSSEGEVDNEKGSIIMYVYSSPVKQKEFRLAQIAMEGLVVEVPGERLNTSVGTASMEWMKISAPVQGWVPFEENGLRCWIRERVRFGISNSGQLNVSVAGSDPTLQSSVPPTTFAEPKAKAEEDSDSDDGALWDWRFNDWVDDNNDEEEEDEDMDQQYDMGDLTDLVAALKKAKELRVGDKVQRNPQCWEGHGNEDGGEGSIGKVVKVEEVKVSVQWPNGHKGQYLWGESGKFELIKVASADDDDDWVREMNNDDKHASVIKGNTRSKCNVCSTALTLDGGTGWFRCNVCSNFNLCRKCFKNMEHPDHVFTDIMALADTLKSTDIVRGSTVRIRPDLKEPRNGWQDAPRDGTPGVVSEMDETRGTVTVMFMDDPWYGQLSEIVVVDAKFEEYAQTYLGSLINHGGEDKRRVPFLVFVVDQQLAPPVIEGKFTVGQKIKARFKGSSARPGEIRAVLPQELYSVAFDDGNFDDKVPERFIMPNEFVKGTRVRVVGSDGLLSTKSVKIGDIGEVVGISPQSAFVLNLRLKVHSNMKVVHTSLRSNEVVLLGEGKWFIVRGEVHIPLPKSAMPIVERAFNDGVSTTDVYVRHGGVEGTYTVAFEAMQVTHTKSGEVLGNLVRDPPPAQPWTKKEERTRFDDGKWHVLSVSIAGGNIVAICDGKTIPVEYTGPNQEEDGDPLLTYMNENGICDLFNTLSGALAKQRPISELDIVNLLLQELQSTHFDQPPSGDTVEKTEEKSSRSDESEDEEDSSSDEADADEEEESDSHSQVKTDVEGMQASNPSDNEEEERKKLPVFSKLPRRPEAVLTLDVRNPILCFLVLPDHFGSLRGKLGPDFPMRYLSRVVLHWGDDSAVESLRGYFATIDGAAMWTCAKCAGRTTRLSETCASCGNERHIDDNARLGRKAKVRVALPKSKEAQEVRKKMHARLRSQYQKQLDALDDHYSSVI